MVFDHTPLTPSPITLTIVFLLIILKIPSVQHLKGFAPLLVQQDATAMMLWNINICFDIKILVQNRWLQKSNDTTSSLKNLHTKYVQKTLKIMQKRVNIPKISQKMQKPFKNQMKNSKTSTPVKS